MKTVLFLLFFFLLCVSVNADFCNSQYFAYNDCSGAGYQCGYYSSVFATGYFSNYQATLCYWNGVACVSTGEVCNPGTVYADFIIQELNCSNQSIGTFAASVNLSVTGISYNNESKSYSFSTGDNGSISYKVEIGIYNISALYENYHVFNATLENGYGDYVLIDNDHFSKMLMNSSITGVDGEGEHYINSTITIYIQPDYCLYSEAYYVVFSDVYCGDEFVSSLSDTSFVLNYSDISLFPESGVTNENGSGYIDSIFVYENLTYNLFCNKSGYVDYYLKNISYDENNTYSICVMQNISCSNVTTTTTITSTTSSSSTTSTTSSTTSTAASTTTSLPTNCTLNGYYDYPQINKTCSVIFMGGSSSWYCYKCNNTECVNGYFNTYYTCSGNVSSMWTQYCLNNVWNNISTGGIHYQNCSNYTNGYCNPVTGQCVIGQNTFNYNQTVPTYDCSNLTGMLLNGDVTHEVLCAFVIPIGAEYTYFLGLILTLGVFYMFAGSTVALFMGLIYLTIAFNLVPQPARIFVGVVLALIITYLLYDLFIRITPRIDRLPDYDKFKEYTTRDITDNRRRFS